MTSIHRNSCGIPTLSSFLHKIYDTAQGRQSNTTKGPMATNNITKHDRDDTKHIYPTTNGSHIKNNDDEHLTSIRSMLAHVKRELRDKHVLMAIDQPKI